MSLKMLQRFIHDEIGVESAEYAMILALICIALIAAVVSLAGAIGARFNSTTKLIDDIP